MKDSLKPGVTHVAKIKIDKDRTISFMGDVLRVYATPRMVLDVEHTCRQLLLPHHDGGEDSLGVRVEIDHLGPTLLGQTVTVAAEVAEVEGSRVIFDVNVHDELDHVGKARHIRFVVDTEKQGGRLAKKKAQLAEA
ncbi:MAG: LysR family transcriptional regulator [Rhodospirillaceae bacterium]|nr:LysR family transcriptional regulator [Rhodospirillaceae bacterium]